MDDAFDLRHLDDRIENKPVIVNYCFMKNNCNK